MTVMATITLRSMARRWRAGEPLDLPTPYSPDPRLAPGRAAAMTLAATVAALLFLGVVAYALFAGADFGSGVWDLTAGDAEQGAPVRSLIDRAVGPVWEANHVWLVFVLVYLWTGFPDAFASIMETLFVPFCLAGVGIVMRGAAFAFRKMSPTLALARFHGVMFATSSVVTPFLFGTIAGAVAVGTGAGRGRRATAGPRGPVRRPWSAAPWPSSPARSSRRCSSPPRPPGAPTRS